VVAWREHLEEIVQSKTKPVLAKAIETTPEALIAIILWKVDRFLFRGKAVPSALLTHPQRNEIEELSPPGYGIHRPSIDEALAAGPLLRSAT